MWLFGNLNGMLSGQHVMNQWENEIQHSMVISNQVIYTNKKEKMPSKVIMKMREPTGK